MQCRSLGRRGPVLRVRSCIHMKRRRWHAKPGPPQGGHETLPMKPGMADRTPYLRAT